MKNIYDEKVDPNEPFKTLQNHISEVSENSKHALLISDALWIENLPEIICQEV